MSFSFYINICIVFLGILLPNRLSGQSGGEEARIEYISKFIEFTAFPPQAQMDNKQRPFVIAVFKDSALFMKVKKVYADKTINEKAIDIVYYQTLENYEYSHVFLFSKVEQEELQKILNKTRDKPVITIASNSGFAEKGILINFLNNTSSHTDFEINETVARKLSINFDFRLLYIAAKVY